MWKPRAWNVSTLSEFDFDGLTKVTFIEAVKYFQMKTNILLFWCRRWHRRPAIEIQGFQNCSNAKLFENPGTKQQNCCTKRRDMQSAPEEHFLNLSYQPSPKKTVIIFLYTLNAQPNKFWAHKIIKRKKKRNHVDKNEIRILGGYSHLFWCIACCGSLFG